MVKHEGNQISEPVDGIRRDDRSGINDDAHGGRRFPALLFQ